MAWLRHVTKDSGQTAPLADSPAAVSDGRANRHAETDVELLTQQIGAELLEHSRGQRGGLFSSRYWSDQLLNWAMKDPALKVQLFRFIDVFPMLTNARLVHEYLGEYLGPAAAALPAAINLGLRAGGLAKEAMARAITRQVTAMAHNFIAGSDALSALPQLERLWREGVAFSVDLLGEACVSDEEAHAYQRRYLELIDTLADKVERWPANTSLEADDLGAVPRANVSVKISALRARTDAIDFEGSLRGLTESLRPILQSAASRGVFVNFDMEQHALKDLTLELFMRCCEEIDFPAGLALQAYLRSGEEDAERIIAWASRTGRQVTVRLIKGAYWDYEVVHAQLMGWQPPVWMRKEDTDACFERMAARFVAALPRRPGEGGVKLALGSHNVRSIAHTLALLRRHGRAESAVEFQMLYGMADQLKAAVLQRGLRLRQYVPVGQMVPGMAYLVRRLLENASNQSWLRACFYAETSAATLLQAPRPSPADPGVCAPSTATADGSGDGRPFANEPLRDFSRPQQRSAFQQAIHSARVPTVACDATLAQGSQAAALAQDAFADWRDTEPLQRAKILHKTAVQMRERRDELAGMIIREAGKGWRDADADVCEAIDYCEYYARCAAELFRPKRLGAFLGELNQIEYQPRGPAVVISPWNFPLAICAGMTAAALAAGNTVIVKPSPRTPGIAQVMCDVLHAAGTPPQVLQFLPGGDALGAALVRDPRVAIIAFTGSKQVGLDILAAAARTADGQNHVKRVICEMGGKNAIIVDESADLDDAVLAVRQSAFGYSGQKCSACSRAIVVDAVYDVFLRRLIESTRTLVIGDPLEPGTDVGPVIDEEAAERIGAYLEIGRHEGTLELACEVPAGLAERVGKPYVGPHIFSAIEPSHRLANEETFGPVLSVMRAADFAEALAIANATAYKLTGGVFSRKPSHLELARRQFRVGNLYLNRAITGAMVGRQPFGGFGLSGTGTQAGGPDYLLHFVEPRCCAENTMRHGFTPGLG